MQVVLSFISAFIIGLFNFAPWLKPLFIAVAKCITVVRV